MLQAALLTNLLFAAPEVLRPSTAPNWGHSSKKGRRPYPSSALHSESSHETESEEVDLPSIHHRRFCKFRAEAYHAPHIERILLLSDLHCDYEANRKWLENICSQTNNDTMILIAGDVSHNLSILQWTFQTLKQSFGEVAFAPGNHDLWLDKPRKHKPIATKLDLDDEVRSGPKISDAGDGCTNSIDKLEKVLQLCADEDVRVGPIKIENKDTQSALWVVPLLSWYHQSFDSEPAIENWGGIPSAKKVVADYRRSIWPEPLSPLDDSLALFLDQLNDIMLDFDSIANEMELHHGSTTSLLTFSHFLPRIDLIPEKRYLTLPTLHSCMGSTFLESRLRNLQSQLVNHHSDNTYLQHLHAFGHSHISWDQELDRVRYVHVPLAYPKEWEQRRRSLEIGTMHGEISQDRFPVCIWEKQSSGGANGFPSEWLGGWWSKYYNIMERQPHRNTELAPWAARRYRKLPGGLIEDFDHAKVEMQHKLQHPSYWRAGSGSWYNVNNQDSK
ncbi:hypothetical protein ACHAXN_006403 [Cyclotella atomus]